MHNAIVVRLQYSKSKVDDLCRGSLQFDRIPSEPLYNTPLVHWTLSRCHSTALWHEGPRKVPSYTACSAWCTDYSGTLGVNNLPRVVAQIMPRPESNPRPLDHKSDRVSAGLNSQGPGRITYFAL